MKLLTVISLLAAIVSLCLSMSLLPDWNRGPFFIDSNQTLSADPNMQLVNSKIATQDEELKRMDRAYGDSVSKLLDSLSVRRGEEELLLELVNLESNVYRHKKIDSISRIADAEVKIALRQFDAKTKIFCEKKGIPILFSSNNNTVVFGTGEKSDLTGEFVKFLKESK